MESRIMMEKMEESIRACGRRFEGMHELDTSSQQQQPTSTDQDRSSQHTLSQTGGRQKTWRRRKSGSYTAYALLVSQLATCSAQRCISLTGSTACSAFNASSVSTSSDLVGLYPFLSTVTDTRSFDTAIQAYVASGYVSQRYGQLIGCSNVNLDNTTAFYARYTTSVLCNAVVQNSATACGLTGNASRPLCADSCAEFAQSEQEITASNVCGNSSSNALSQIRADFTNCALPADSLTDTCIPAVYNEPDNCGYSSNLGSLCSYCASSSQNATDSCCVFSNTTTRCENVVLPVVASAALSDVVTTMVVTSTASAATSTSTAMGTAAERKRTGLSSGAIAGIVIGAVLGALALLALIIFGCLLFRKRRASSPVTSVFNQPATMRQVAPPSSGYTDGTRDREGERAGLAVLPGGRVTRMTALEDDSGSSQHSQSPMVLDGDRKSASSERQRAYTRDGDHLSPPQTAGKRSGSLSSGSQFMSAVAAARAFAEDTSPSSGEEYTSPDSNGRSEQLAFFKDYYSSDEVHAGDLVATLWTYEPRAADEFHLERGDMVKVIGIWDDGWATGVRVRVKAEDWRPARDSGMTNGSRSGSSERGGSRDGDGEIKAFPMVCVCLPQHWRKTVEGESTDGRPPY